jgi:hypothetical protein
MLNINNTVDTENLEVLSVFTLSWTIFSGALAANNEAHMDSPSCPLVQASYSYKQQKYIIL